MRELQSTGQELLVTFCHHHRPPIAKERRVEEVGICVWAEEPLARSSQVPGSAVYWGPCVRDARLLRHKASALSSGSQFGSQTTEREQEFIR